MNEEDASDYSSAEPPDDMNTEPNEPVLFRLYEAADGFRGTYEEVVAHEAKKNLNKVAGAEENDENDGANDPIIYRIYEAPDGFRGTYDQVLEHEQKNCLHHGETQVNKPKIQLYEAPDGFRGTYEEVLAHEQELLGNSPSWDKKTHIYQSPDGFEGLHDEVLAHEKKMGYIEPDSNKIVNENPKLLLRVIDNFQSQVKRLNARVAELEQALAVANHSKGLNKFNDFTYGL